MDVFLLLIFTIMNTAGTSGAAASQGDDEHRESDHVYGMASVELYLSFVELAIGETVSSIEPLETKMKELISLVSDSIFRVKTAKGEDIVHIELQAQNHPNMHYRMGTYSLNIYNEHEILPRQYVIYIGTEPLNMPNIVRNSDNSSHVGFHIIQPKLEWDAEYFLKSDDPSAVAWAALCSTDDEESMIYRLFRRLTEIEPNLEQRKKYGRQIQLLTDNTSLKDFVTKYMNLFKIEIDPTNDDYYQKGKGIGREEGREEGIEIGIERGKLYTAAELIHSGLISLEATVEKLKLNAEEIEQLRTILAQMQDKQ
jgi:predicted transposase YdaD